MFSFGVRPTCDHGDPVTYECVWLCDGIRGGVFGVVLFEEVETSIAGFEGLDEGGVNFAKGFEEGETRGGGLDVFGGDVFEVVDDGVYTDASEAIAGPAEAVGQVDGHVDGCMGSIKPCWRDIVEVAELSRCLLSLDLIS